MTSVAIDGPRAREGDAGPLFSLTDRLFRAGTLNEVYSASLDAIEELLGCERASILLFNDDGVMRFVSWRGLSDGYRQALDGHSPWVAGQRAADPIFVPDIQETDEPEWLKLRIASEGIVGLAFVPLFANGEVVGKFMTYFPGRHEFTEHDRECAIAIARQVGFSLERYRAEAAKLDAVRRLKESEERFRLMSEHAPIMIWISDSEGRCLHLNQLLRTFWGLETAEGFDWASTLHPEDLEGVTNAMRDAILAKTSAHVKGRYRRHDGNYRVLETVARTNFRSTGEFEGMIGVNVDITEREEADQHKRLLINELNHRVKNTLAVVQAIAGQTFRSDAPRNVQQQTFEGRLAALAQAHNLLSAEHWQSASLEEVARSSVNGDADLRIHLSGPHVNLGPKQAVTTAMALHELYTNAVKHGSLRTPDGMVAFEWNVVTTPAPALVMRWAERGSSPVKSPTRRGFGMTMIEQALASELDGDVDMNYSPSGLVCTVTARLPAGSGET
jgi:PAS domain S-box-containing protein